MTEPYELILGLEVHIELKTATKIFCACPNTYGGEPNTHCCPVCMGYPGALPVLNQRVVEYAVAAGLATNCAIAPYSKQDRKNYFYPDLPKAYQISQYDLPLCQRGWLDIETETGPKRIGITRIHIEEDAGKLLHGPEGTLLDCNRCGAPLIEIVSEPDLRSAEEARAYLRKLRAIILYTGVADCKMNEGGMRCDVNLSIRKPGGPLGTRTEMKNLNSFQFIAKAIEYEYARQVAVLEEGGAIVQETRRFDPATGKTYPMRLKEDANDYRYFPDPDLPPVETPGERVAEIAQTLRELPDARKARYTREYKLSPYDGELLTADKDLADFFEACAARTRHPKTLAHLLTDLPREAETFTSPLPPEHFAELADLLGDEVINNGTAKRVLKDLWQRPGSPRALVAAEGLAQINDRPALLAYAQSAVQSDRKSAAAYRAGKEAAAQALIGKAMALSGGRANPRRLREVTLEVLAGEG